MYTTAIKRDLIAQHYLVGGCCSEENRKHSHYYKVEIKLEGRELNQNGYLIDILEIESLLRSQLDYYRDKTLNDMPEFEGLNPSIEHFAFILCMMFSNKIRSPNISTITAKVWEDDNAWASYKSSAKESDI